MYHNYIWSIVTDSLISCNGLVIVQFMHFVALMWLIFKIRIGGSFHTPHLIANS
jgi:hypothetical protein